MELKKAQIKTEEYFKKSGFKKWPKFVILARLFEEISEIEKILSVKEGYREKWKANEMDFEEEFGDALFQLFHLANECGIDMDSAFKKVLKKYEKYYKK